MGEPKSKENKFIKGAAILAASGLVIKVLGALLQIPLNNWIGPQGMSYYGVAYSIYSALLVLSTAGIPIAISRMVSEHIAVKEYRYAHHVFRTAEILMLIIGSLSFAICFFGADMIAHAIRSPEAASALRAIAPALFFVPLFSSYRGYFNGRQNMTPTALSEIAEQMVRVVVGIALAYMFYRTDPVKASAGATFGASAGSIAGLLVIVGIYLLNRKTFMKKIERGNPDTDSMGRIAKDIFIIAVPIIIGSEIMPIMNLIDTTMIMRVLQNEGWTRVQSEYLYGLLTAFCSSIISFPYIITQAVTVSLVPALSGRFKVKDQQGIQDTISQGYRTTMVIAFPCAVGIIAIAEPILKLLYFAQPKACHDAAPILSVMAVSIVFLSIMQTSTSILQSVGKQMLPVRNLAIGCIGKMFATYFLVAVPALNVKGACLGTIVAYIIAMALNARDVKKYTHAKVNMDLTYLRPGLVSLVMGVCVHYIYRFVTGPLSGHSPMAVNALGCLISILAGVVIYAVLIFAVKAITVDELETFPMGHRLAAIARKFVR